VHRITLRITLRITHASHAALGNLALLIQRWKCAMRMHMDLMSIVVEPLRVTQRIPYIRVRALMTR
jgi:hypothetical protein